ncbi:long-chain fatty acid transport protein 6 [Rhinichthys klamathensis goyatoka]|uniref:long-chain fatty acid transport protein 6 n=1 Tax=Rhinichthys klamathensis goyatoka TaxID=3034132 RepID=UPI0024B5D55E|nr:long-chain fatty acid transport protein 6 [Rhinichthys klamathensis goyatoka]
MSWAIAPLAVGIATLLLVQRKLYPYFWEDLLYYARVRRVGKAMMARMKRGVVTYLQCFELQARNIPQKAFIVFEDQVLSYRDADVRSNRFANVLRSHCGLRHGDIVALLMNNEPDFICVWFGLCKLGCEVAFLNFNIKSQSLQHCLHSCGAKALVVGSDLMASLEEVLPTLMDSGIDVCVAAERSSLKDSGIDVCVAAERPSLKNIRTLLDQLDSASPEKPELDAPPPNLMDNFLFIFTSGTTGLPKAARISHIKAVMCMAFLRLCGARGSDRVYLPLPLYHMSASLLGIGGCIQLGATCVLKRKFSASQFWKDCLKYDITVFQYIGELCRYLVNQPKTAEEASHKVRLAAGSGLRADVWKELVRRFGKIQIREAYGLTEASIGFVNYTDEIGPIGRASYFNKLNLPFEFLKCDPQTYEPIRTDSGHCIKVSKGEAGLLVAPVMFTNPFLGYAGDKAMSERKLLRDVFRTGDVYFNTGDLMLQDHRDFVYFKDRIGDTFRWKGENVSTTEVSEVLGGLDFLLDVSVYGVTVPGYEGRVGMAAVVLKDDHGLDGERLYSHLIHTLPPYAWPWFLRVQTSLDMTDTFKQQKGRLVQQGFSPHTVQQPLYFLDASQRTYTPLTAHTYQHIVSGKKRL